MADASAITIQTGAHQYNDEDLEKYSLMMGGLNVTRDVLDQYDPLVTGYYRLFMVRKPIFLSRSNNAKMRKFKHILEYGNIGVDGLGDVTLDMSEISGGYAGRSFSVPTVAKDDTTGFSVKVYEFSGSPVREILHSWINGISDTQSGLAHYNGLIATGDLAYKQSNHTAEFIYVVTDRTGMNVEYACLFANCMPKGYKNDQFNSGTAGDHSYVDTTIEFTCTKYESIDINKKAAKLLRNYQILANSLEFYSGLHTTGDEEVASVFNTKTGYSNKTGKLENRDNIEYFTGQGSIEKSKATNGTNNVGNTGNIWSDTSGDEEVIKVTPSFTNAGYERGQNKISSI